MIEFLPLSFYTDLGFRIWLVWLMFTASVWVTFLAIRFWLRIFKRMSVFSDTD